MIITILAGFFSGIISGMGIGGGAILIPVLTAFMGIEQKVAQCVNLVYFIPTAVTALIIHIRNKSVDLKTALFVTGFGVVGAVIGSFLAIWISGGLLRKLFAIFLFAIGINQFFDKRG